MVETRRQQIEDAASSLFRERGYAATSVRDIAQALNLQGGSLYAHVASKEDVLWAIVLGAADRFRDAMEPIMDEPGLTAAERLRRMVRAHVAVITSDLGNASVFLHEWRFLGDARRERIARRRDEYEAVYRGVLEDGSERGEFTVADSRLVATLILSALNGIAGWYHADGRLTPDEIAQQHADLFTRALACPREEAHR